MKINNQSIALLSKTDKSGAAEAADPEAELSDADLLILPDNAIALDLKNSLKIHTDQGTYPEGQIIKNEYDLPLKKSNASEIWVVWKTNSGECWFSNSLFINKTYEGAGTYSAAFAVYPSYGNIQKIACENVK
jgi:hypothetical protein